MWAEGIVTVRQLASMGMVHAERRGNREALM